MSSTALTEEIRARLTEIQAEKLQKRIAAFPFKVTYQEEQHGAVLVAIIRCTAVQAKFVRDLLHEIGAAVA